MPRLVRVLAIGVAAMLMSVPRMAAAQPQPPNATAEIRDTAGRTVANVEFREGRGEVLVTMIFPNPAPLTGTHGVRIHEVGRCDPPDFSSAGAGFNPTGKQHGRLNPNGPQVGDLPNVNFTTGLTSYNTTAQGATLGSGPTSLLDSNRSSVIVYANADDQLTEPDGKAGARVACGVINPTGAGLPGASTGVGGAQTPLIIAALGVLMIGAGYFLRRQRSVVRSPRT
jgi:superoxide dismutase, Cu-Zn family